MVLFRRTQIGRLAALSAAFWMMATLYIHFLPRAFTSPVPGLIGFLTTLPMAWLSVVVTRLVAKLTPDQFLAGVCLVGAPAMMLDGVALRWFPGVYSGDHYTVTLGAGWLLWGYGVSLAIALFMSSSRAAS